MYLRFLGFIFSAPKPIMNSLSLLETSPPISIIVVVAGGGFHHHNGGGDDLTKKKKRARRKILEAYLKVEI